jgi:hypothetical protein
VPEVNRIIAVSRIELRPGTTATEQELIALVG